MPIFRSIRLYALYTTAYGVQHCKGELCLSGWYHFTFITFKINNTIAQLTKPQP